MGKIRRARQKAHIAAVKVKAAGDKDGNKDSQAMDMEMELPLPELTSNQDTSGLFEGLDLKKFNLTTKLPDIDAQSAITNKSLKELKMKKKDKRKLRHELWMKKVDALNTAKKTAKEKKQKEQTPVVGDIGVLGEALPTLELLMKQPKGPNDKRKKPKGIQKETKRRKQMMSDIAVFHQVLQHPAYKENPMGTISEHLQNRHKLENRQT